MVKNRRIILTIIIFLIIYILYMIGNHYFNKYNIIYIEDFLSQNEYNKILKLDRNKRNFKYEGFRYTNPNLKKEVYNIFYSNKNLNRIRKRINNKNIMKSNFPIEHRIYDKDSNGMAWHKDLLMYKEPQYEAIFTIRNESNSFTEWIDERKGLHSLWTRPNSLLIVKADSFKHHVSPTIDGEREILKIVYTQTNKPNKEYYNELKRFKY